MRRRFLAIAALALVLLGMGAASAIAGPLGQAAGTKQVGLVVAFPDGTHYADVVTVPADATTFDVLQKANIQLISTTEQFGPAICSINKTGCPASNCFCDKSHFWAFYHLDANTNTWVSAQEGAGAAKPASGAVEGFIWSGVDASFNPTDKPPVLTFDQIKAQAGRAQAASSAQASPAGAAGTGAGSTPAALPRTGSNSPLLLVAAAGAALLAMGVVLSRRGRKA